MVDPLRYFFSIQQVLNDWYYNGHSMCYSACEMMFIKEPLLLIGNILPNEKKEVQYLVKSLMVPTLG